MEKEQAEKKMLSFLKEIGLWNDLSKRFLLPASNHFIDGAGFINELGPKLVDLMKISDRLMREAVEKNINSGGMAFFRRAAQVGIPKNRKRYQRLINGVFPETMKVDLVKGVDGKFHIVEIDTVNTHGLGYGKIFQVLESFLGFRGSNFIGTEEALNQSPLEVIVPFADRFYEGEWGSASNVIETLSFHREGDVSPSDFKNKTILDINERLNPSFQEELVNMFLLNEVKVLVPPKDCLGSKNVLPLIWHSETGKILLKEGCDLDFIKGCLPEARFVEKKFDFSDFSDDSWLVKKVNSDPIKGVMSPSEYVEREIASNFGAILQKKIEQQEQLFSFFNQEGELCEEKLFSRYVVYFKSDGTPLDCLYTATSEELTHGGTEAVMGVCSW